MSKNKSVIVKKVKKVSGGGHHGGAWKVAYADFVTAMMAFFLLMWLLNMTSDEKRARLSMYFKYFSIYESGGTSWMDKSSEIFAEAGENTQKVFADKQHESIENPTTTAEFNSMEEAIKKDIAEKLNDVQDQILIDIVNEGIRIQMIDKEGSLMFERGSNRLTPKAKQILKIISEDIKNLSNKIIIEGHTDSLSYAGSQYSNWELSTERASSARKELEASGLDTKRITRVAGYADTDPLIKDNPQDPQNRRISITLSGPQNIGSKKANIKTIELESNEKQLRETSKELVSILDNGVPAKKEDRATSDIVKGIYNSNGNTNIKQDERKGKEPSVTKNEGKSPAVIRELSEPIIIKEKLFSITPNGK
ncbi:MAG: OmpA family protein [Nitrospirae bacterium]|nr:OmpA family protein [Nitrospirota bacterium]